VISWRGYWSGAISGSPRRDQPHHQPGGAPGIGRRTEEQIQKYGIDVGNFVGPKIAQDVVNFAKRLREILSLHPVDRFQPLTGVHVVKCECSIRLLESSHRTKCVVRKHPGECRHRSEPEESTAIHVGLRKLPAMYDERRAIPIHGDVTFV
jgi:hypothetical protein